MPRASRAVAESHRREILAAAARLIRERGPEQVSVPEFMAAAGLTHGGFYRHFASKDDLVGQAVASAFATRQAVLDELVDDAPDDEWATFLDYYLSERHRDHPAEGCAAVALAPTAGRGDSDAVRAAYTDGVRAMTAGLQRLRHHDPEHEQDPEHQQDPEHEQDPSAEALADLATLVGALALSRACDDPDLSRNILTAARERLLESDPHDHH